MARKLASVSAFPFLPALLLVSSSSPLPLPSPSPSPLLSPSSRLEQSVSWPYRSPNNTQSAYPPLLWISGWWSLRDACTNADLAAPLPLLKNTSLFSLHYLSWPWVIISAAFGEPLASSRRPTGWRQLGTANWEQSKWVASDWVHSWNGVKPDERSNDNLGNPAGYRVFSMPPTRLSPSYGANRLLAGCATGWWRWRVVTARNNLPSWMQILSLSDR